MANYTCSTGHYYNSTNNGNLSGYYYASNRKVRLTISNNSWLIGKNISRAYLSMPIDRYYNGKTAVYHACETTGQVDTVFPSETVDDSSIVADYVEKPGNTHFYPVKSYDFDITNLLIYAQKNYSGTWYLWQGFKNGDGTSREYTAPTITIEEVTSSGKTITPYVYHNGDWYPAVCKVYKNGEWQTASANFYQSGWISEPNLVSTTYPTSSMGSNNSDYASASSIYADHDTAYKPVCVLGSDTAGGWMSSDTATNPWIQIRLPHDAYDIEVTMTNATNNSRGTNGPISGSFYYSDRINMETVIANLKPTNVTFSGRDGSTKGATTVHKINNKYPIRSIAVRCDSWYKKSGTGFCCIGKLSFKYKYKP